MGRLIDKDALLAEYDSVHIGEAGRARKLIEDAPEVFTYTDDEIQKMQDMQSAEIEKAFELGREDAKPQWIPRSSTERPKDREEVMVTIDDGYKRYTDTDEYVNGHFWYHDDKHIVAWKSFEEPWRGEEHGET